MNTDFAAWEHATLARFAKEAYQHMQEQDARIEALEADVKMLLERNRELMRREMPSL